MKKNVLTQPIKMRNKFSPSEIYYTFPQWGIKEIDGVQFLPVNKNYPTHTSTQQIHYIRKDSLERVK
jgi:hypothetical protein